MLGFFPLGALPLLAVPGIPPPPIVTPPERILSFAASTAAQRNVTFATARFGARTLTLD